MEAAPKVQGCLRTFWGNSSNSGRFDTSSYMPEPHLSLSTTMATAGLSPKGKSKQKKSARRNSGQKKAREFSKNKKAKRRQRMTEDTSVAVVNAEDSTDEVLSQCKLRFIGSQDEVIQISLFKYQLG